jgi:hypothetical protein
MARRRLLPVLAEVRRRASEAEAFFADMDARARKTLGLLEVINDEDARRANSGVAVESVAAPPIPPKVCMCAYVRACLRSGQG